MNPWGRAARRRRRARGSFSGRTAGSRERRAAPPAGPPPADLRDAFSRAAADLSARAGEFSGKPEVSRSLRGGGIAVDRVGPLRGRAPDARAARRRAAGSRSPTDRATCMRGGARRPRRCPARSRATDSPRSGRRRRSRSSIAVPPAPDRRPASCRSRGPSRCARPTSRRRSASRDGRRRGDRSAGPALRRSSSPAARRLAPWLRPALRRCRRAVRAS